MLDKILVCVLLATGILLIVRSIKRLLVKRSDLPDFNKLVSQIKTKANEDQIDRAIEYHNKRVAAGANAEESLNRLERDLVALGETD